jgi:branched-subunit amino acid transport protein
MTAWLVVLAIGLIGYALQALVLVTVATRPLTDRVLVPMRLVGPAALAALTATLVFTHGGALRSVPVAELVAIVAGTLAVRRTGAVVNAFLVGLPVFWLLTLAGI